MLARYLFGMNVRRFVGQHATAAFLTVLMALTVFNIGLGGLNYYLRRLSTHTPVAAVTQPFLLASGIYCGDDTNVRQRREQLSAIIKGFEKPSTEQKSIDDILTKVSENTVRVFSLQDYNPTATNGFQARPFVTLGVYFGGSYFVTVGHGVHNIVNEGPIAGKNSYPLFSINATTLLVESLQQPDATRLETNSVWSVTSFPQHDIALLYSPAQPPSSYQFKLRSAETLAVGEKVYAVVRRGDSAEVLGGVVERLNESFADISKSYAAYRGHVLTTIPSQNGDSGSPVFDAFGNMVGLVSGGNVNRASAAIAPLDSLTELALAEQQRLICRPEEGSGQLQFHHKT